MNTADLASPLLPQDAHPVDVFDASAPSSGADTSRIAAHAPAREIRDLPGHLAKRIQLATRVRTAANSGRLNVTSIRWPADSGHRQGVPARVRSAILGGSLHVVTPPDTTRVLDLVLTQIGAANTGTVQIGSGGGLRTRTEAAGRPAILRLGKMDTPADPSRHYAGLRAARGIPEVPVTLGQGGIGDVMWSAESLISGRVQTRLDPTTLSEADQFLRSLPAADRVTTPLDQIARLAALAGSDANAVRAIGERIGLKLAGIPGVLIHGDFWMGNLLFRKGTLVAVVDWDGWEPAGAPATDLLHLLADCRRRQDRTSYGAQAVDRFWRYPKVRRLLDQHLSDLGLPSDNGTVDALGESWWLTAIAAAVTRNPKLATDPAWIQRNLRQAAVDLAKSN